MAMDKNHAKEVMFRDFTAVKKSGHIRTQPNRHKVEPAKATITRRGRK